MTKLHVAIGGIIILIIGLFIGSSMSMDEDNAMMATNIIQEAQASEISVSADGSAIWQFPDKRKLDPELFGTPAAPINVDLLPLSNRETNADGTAYTTIKEPSMFSNNIKETSGSFTMTVLQKTVRIQRILLKWKQISKVPVVKISK